MINIFFTIIPFILISASFCRNSKINDNVSGYKFDHYSFLYNQCEINEDGGELKFVQVGSLIKFE